MAMEGRRVSCYGNGGAGELTLRFAGEEVEACHLKWAGLVCARLSDLLVGLGLVQGKQCQYLVENEGQGRGEGSKHAGSPHVNWTMIPARGDLALIKIPAKGELYAPLGWV